MTRRRLLLAGLFLVAACKRKRRAPEERIRDLVTALETAVEEKDLGPIKAALSEKFKGGEQNDRRSVIGILQLLFLRHPQIHLLVRVKHVEMTAPGQAFAEILVAMASVPLRDAHELPRVEAELMEFGVSFAEEEADVFRIVGATWERARLESFL